MKGGNEGRKRKGNWKQRSETQESKSKGSRKEEMKEEREREN